MGYSKKMRKIALIRKVPQIEKKIKGEGGIYAKQPAKMGACGI